MIELTDEFIGQHPPSHRSADAAHGGARASAGVLCARRQARDRRRQRRPAPPGRSNCCRPPVRRSTSMPAARSRNLPRSPRSRRAGRSQLHERAWAEADLAGAAIAIGGFADDEDAARFARAARAAGVPVNVIDKPQFCDFAFGAIVNRSPLVIGISTDGAAPVFGQAIRAKLEALIPRGFARLGRGGAALARRREDLRPLLRGAPALLATVHGARAAQPASGAGRERSREPACAHANASRGGRGRVGDPGRCRPRRSGTADAESGARAAIRRRDPV